MFENTTYVLFSHREAIGKAFEKWAEENHALKCWNSFLAFLQGQGMLNEKAVREYLDKEGKP